MKRIAAIGGIAVLLLAAGWSLVWWLDRDALVRAFDAEVARLEAAGWAVDWAERAVGGFPFGYEIRLTGLSAADPASGFAVRLPQATVENDGAEGVLVRLPPTFAADVPLPAADGAPTPPVLETTAEAAGLLLRLAGAGGVGQTVGVEAKSLVWRLRPLGASADQALTFEGLDASLTSAAGTETVFRLQAGLYGVNAAMEEGDGEPQTMSARYQGVTLTGKTRLPKVEALGEMLYAGAPGYLELALQAGPAEARVTGGEGDRRGTVDWKGGSISAVATLTSGRLELQGETRQNVWALQPASPSTMIGGELSAGMVQATYSMPMAPAPQPDHMAIRLALLDVALDEAAWAAIDPQGRLAHGPAELVIDVSGTARVTRRIDEMNPGDPPPFEISELEVREIALDALGASARASGSLELLQPIGLPLGTIQIGMTGAAALIDALGQAGVLTPEMVEMADAMLEVYATPAQRGDAWTTEITFTNEGPLVNGLPIR